MTNFERFNGIEKQKNVEIEKLREIATQTDSYWMNKNMSAQCDKIKQYESECNRMITDFSGKWDEEYIKTPLEELGVWFDV